MSDQPGPNSSVGCFISGFWLDDNRPLCHDKGNKKSLDKGNRAENETMIEIDRKELLQQFASDNYAGICPEAWRAAEAANHGHATSYGDDPWTAKASDAFRELFETDCEVFFVFNGTAANSLALASLCQSYHGVICCDSDSC